MDTNYFKAQNTGIAHAMVDLETMGTRTDSPILTIGCVLFNPFEINTYEQLKDRSFYRVIDVEDSLKWCPNLEGGTLKWWLLQKADVLQKLVQGESVLLKNGLIDLSNYCTNRSEYSPLPKPYRPMTPPATIVWAKGPDFDCKILENASRALGIPTVFHFSNHRCVRTIVDAGFPDPDTRPVFKGDAHDARDDAINQALTVQLAYQALNLHQEKLPCPAS